MPKIELFEMDCMELMAKTPDRFYDLAICDPPYGIDAINMVYKNRGGYVNKNSKVSTQKATHKIKDWDSHTPDKSYFEELFRVSKNQIIWGANHFTDKLPISKAWIFWDKDNYSDFSDGELAWTSFDRSLKRVLYVWNGMRQGKHIGGNSCKGGNFKFGNKDNLEKRIHPTQKPVKLYEWLLSNYTKEGDIILDTHLGSGSSAIAAYNLGFDFTGCEIDKEYFENAKKRFDIHSSQLLIDL